MRAQAQLRYDIVVSALYLDLFYLEYILISLEIKTGNHYKVLLHFPGLFYRRNNTLSGIILKRVTYTLYLSFLNVGSSTRSLFESVSYW